MPKPPIKRRVPAIISASRLTDIPRFYAEWFVNRRRAGYCHSGNSFGGRYLISLQKEDVLGYLFWTRDARPLLPEITSIRRDGVPVAVQFTITGYGPELEANRVPLDDQINSFIAVADVLPAPSCIQLRYDPIIVSEEYSPAWHEQTLGYICGRLRGHTVIVNTSICEPYVTVVSRMATILTAQYRTLNSERHSSTAKRFPRLAILEPTTLLKSLADVAKANGMSLRVCANPEIVYGGQFAGAQCCGNEIFAAYPADQVIRIRDTAAGPSRAGCQCLSTADIGMSDSCPAGCQYCYATGALLKSRRFFERHDPTAEAIR
jgi:hypothetical protein